MSLAFGAIVLLIGSIVKRFDEGKIDLFFWLGIFLGIFLIIALTGIMRKIAQKTKEIKEL